MRSSHWGEWEPRCVGSLRRRSGLSWVLPIKPGGELSWLAGMAITAAVALVSVVPGQAGAQDLSAMAADGAPAPDAALIATGGRGNNNGNGNIGSNNGNGNAGNNNGNGNVGDNNGNGYLTDGNDNGRGWSERSFRNWKRSGHPIGQYRYGRNPWREPGGSEGRLELDDGWRERRENLARPGGGEAGYPWSRMQDR